MILVSIVDCLDSVVSPFLLSFWVLYLAFFRVCFFLCSCFSDIEVTKSASGKCFSVTCFEFAAAVPNSPAHDT